MGSFLESLRHDLRYTVRGLIARPGFLATIVLTLALGIGINTAIFSVFQQVLLRPLPVPQPEQLVNVSSPGTRQGWTTSNDTGGRDSIFSYPLFRDLERSQDGIVALAAHRREAMNFAYDGTTRNGDGTLVSGSYFETLRLAPALGRLLNGNDDRIPGVAQSVVLSHAYWERSFGSDPGVIGRTMVVNGQPMSIVGVAPAGFEGITLGDRPDVFVPISARWSTVPGSLPDHEDRQTHWVYVFGRLANGTTMAQAQTALNGPFRAIINDVEAPLQKMSEQRLAEFRARSLVLDAGIRGQSTQPGEVASSLSMLMAVAVLVLLIACVNIANLQMARGAARSSEMAVRSAIGASASRLRRQTLLESSVLAMAGALAALPVAMAALKGFAMLLPADDAGSLPMRLAPAAIGFAFAAAVVTVLLFGLFPALQSSRTAPIDALKSQAGQPGGGRAAHRFRVVLGTLQIAFSLVLLVLAGLFARSLANAANVDLGMRVESLLTFAVSPELNGYDPARSQQLFTRIEDEMATLPGVERVALSMMPLVADSSAGTSVSVEGFRNESGAGLHAYRNDVGPGFFDTLGITLLAGREFVPADTDGGQRVAIVNQAFTEKYGLGEAAVGKRIALNSGDEVPLDIEIVGVARNAVYSQVKEETSEMIYLPIRQNTELGAIQVYLRSVIAPAAQMQAVTEAMARLDPNLPIEGLRTMTAQIDDNLAMDRLIGVLSATFALLATLLAATGLYGLLSYMVTQRTREIGLRLALGAAPGRVRGLVLGQIGRMALVGGVIGIALAMLIGTAAQSLLFGLQGRDPLVFVAAVIALFGVILVAGWMPAWRATRVDPMKALRSS
jgi:putative ABC transport system permease protein